MTFAIALRSTIDIEPSRVRKSEEKMLEHSAFFIYKVFYTYP